MSGRDFKIIQLSPSDGWYALYFLQNEPYFELRRLLAFALLEQETGQTTFDAITKDMSLCLVGLKSEDESDPFAPHFNSFYHERDLTQEQKDKFVVEGKTRVFKHR